MKKIIIMTAALAGLSPVGASTDFNFYSNQLFVGAPPWIERPLTSGMSTLPAVVPWATNLTPPGPEKGWENLSDEEQQTLLDFDIESLVDGEVSEEIKSILKALEIDTNDNLETVSDEILATQKEIKDKRDERQQEISKLVETKQVEEGESLGVMDYLSLYRENYGQSEEKETIEEVEEPAKVDSEAFAETEIKTETETNTVAKPPIQRMPTSEMTTLDLFKCRETYDTPHALRLEEALAGISWTEIRSFENMTVNPALDLEDLDIDKERYAQETMAACTENLYDRARRAKISTGPLKLAHRSLQNKAVRQSRGEEMLQELFDAIEAQSLEELVGSQELPVGLDQMNRKFSPEDISLLLEDKARVSTKRLKAFFTKQGIKIEKRKEINQWRSFLNTYLRDSAKGFGKKGEEWVSSQEMKEMKAETPAYALSSKALVGRPKMLIFSKHPARDLADTIYISAMLLPEVSDVSRPGSQNGFNILKRLIYDDEQFLVSKTEKSAADAFLRVLKDVKNDMGEDFITSCYGRDPKTGDLRLGEFRKKNLIQGLVESINTVLPQIRNHAGDLRRTCQMSPKKIKEQILAEMQNRCKSI